MQINKTKSFKYTPVENYKIKSKQRLQINEDSRILYIVLFVSYCNKWNETDSIRIKLMSLIKSASFILTV